MNEKKKKNEEAPKRLQRRKRMRIKRTRNKKKNASAVWGGEKMERVEKYYLLGINLQKKGTEGDKA